MGNELGLGTQQIKEQVELIIDTFGDSKFKIDDVATLLMENNKYYLEIKGIISPERKEAMRDAAELNLNRLVESKILIINNDGTYSKI